MTIRDIAWIVEEELMAAGAPNEAIDRKVLLQMANESIQHVYTMAVMADPTFYYRSQTFASAATVNYPANYASTVLVEVPFKSDGTTATPSGAAIMVGYRDLQNRINNPQVAPTEDDPEVVTRFGQLAIFPNCTGVHYFIANIPEISNELLDLNALHDGGNFAVIPWAFQEAVVLHTKILAATREAMKPDTPVTQATRYLEAAKESRERLQQALQPYEVWRKEVGQKGYAIPQAARPAGSNNRE